jgi:hypothetical protein
MKLVLHFALLLVAIKCHGQSNDTSKYYCEHSFDKNLKKEVYDFVQKYPKFPGGDIGFLTFIDKELNGITETDMAMGPHSFYLQYIIDENGVLFNEHIKNKNISDLTNLEKAVLKVIAKSPKWEPGECNGKRVAVRMFFPLHF